MLQDSLDLMLDFSVLFVDFGGGRLSKCLEGVLEFCNFGIFLNAQLYKRYKVSECLK